MLSHQPNKIPMSTGAEAVVQLQKLFPYSALQHEKGVVHVPAATAFSLPQHALSPRLHTMEDKIGQ